MSKNSGVKERLQNKVRQQNITLASENLKDLSALTRNITTYSLDQLSRINGILSSLDRIDQEDLINLFAGSITEYKSFLSSLKNYDIHLITTITSNNRQNSDISEKLVVLKSLYTKICTNISKNFVSNLEAFNEVIYDIADVGGFGLVDIIYNKQSSEGFCYLLLTSAFF